MAILSNLVGILNKTNQGSTWNTDVSYFSGLEGVVGWPYDPRPSMFRYPKTYDVLVIGAGHAGVEAALAAARSERISLYRLSVHAAIPPKFAVLATGCL